MKPDQATLRRLLDYNILSGKLYWKTRTIQDCATERVVKIWNTRSAGKEAFTATNPKGYKQGAIFNKPYTAHEIIWCWAYGYYAEQIDHDDGIKSHNWLSNLIDSNNLHNHHNMGIQISNTSGQVGVDWVKKDQRWRSRITVDGTIIGIGYFREFADAVKARKSAEIKYGFHRNHGDRVRCQNTN